MKTSPFHKVEFARAYRLTMTSIEPVSFSVPRVKAACFQVMLLMTILTMLTTLLVMNILIRTTCSHRRGTCGSQQWQRLSGWLEKTALRYAHFLFPASLSLSSLSCTLSLCSLSCTLLLSFLFHFHFYLQEWVSLQPEDMRTLSGQAQNVNALSRWKITFKEDWTSPSWTFLNLISLWLFPSNMFSFIVSGDLIKFYVKWNVPCQ